MSYPVFLGLLELAALGSCFYGGYSVFQIENQSEFPGGTVIALIALLWFVFGALSNFCGLVALFYIMFGTEDETEGNGSTPWIQYHYLLAWLTIVVGYPTFVDFIWMAHFPTPMAHLHFLLMLIPLMAWMSKKTRLIVLMTQMACTLALLSHLFIAFKANQMWGLIGGGIMIWNVIALSIPTKYRILGISSREAYVIGMAATTICFMLEVQMAANDPVRLDEIF